MYLFQEGFASQLFAREECDHLTIACKCQSHTSFGSANLFEKKLDVETIEALVQNSYQSAVRVAYYQYLSRFQYS